MWFWLRASPKVAIKMLAGAVALQGPTGTEESILRQLTHEAGKYVLALGGDLGFNTRPLHRAS